MKDNNPVLKRINKSGFSLVEVIVSMTLLVVVATMLLTGVMAAAAINAKSTDLTNQGYNQAAELEEQYKNQLAGDNYDVTISAKGQNSVVSGYLITSKDDYTGVGFTMFVPISDEIIIPPGGFENTPSQAVIGGNTKYVIYPKYTLSDYFFTNRDDGEIEIKARTIFYERGAYYISKDDDEDLKFKGNGPPLPQGVFENYLNNKKGKEPNAVKINIADDPDNLPALSVNTKPGDIKKNGNNLYVFLPEDWSDWADKKDWEKEWHEVLGDEDNWVKLKYTSVVN